MHSTPLLSQTPFRAVAALGGLFVLALVMFVAILGGVEPHPPGSRGPYLGAMMALSGASIYLLLVRDRAGLWVGAMTALAFLPSVGPHKFWTEPAAQALAPLIVVGTLCALAALLTLWHAVRAERARPSSLGCAAMAP